MKIVDDTMPVISKERVFRLLGQKDKGVSGRLSKKIDKQIAGLEKMMRPQVLYTTKKIRKIEGSTVTLEGNVKLKSAKISKTFRKCDRITFFLATLGEQVDDVISSSLKEKKLSDAYIYDAIGSAAVEATVEDFQNKMDSTVKAKNQRTTLRFSPGYCDWKISEQKKVFSVLENDLIDVDLNESYLMAPRKSVSGIFGVGSREFVDKDETNPCRLCGMHTCVARRV
jgi:cobalamin-dependent methionine synthase I